MRNVFRHPSAPVAVCAMTAILVFATDRAAFGSLIDVQFASDGQFPGYVWATGQPYTGAAIVGSAGDYWNPVLISFAEDETQQVPLLDSAQATTPAQLLVTHAGGWSDDNQAPVQPFANTPIAALMRQYAFSHTTGLFQVTNLTPGTYDLYLYSAGDHDGQTRVTDITVNGIQGSVGPNNSADSLVEGVNYLHFQPVVADDGLLTIFFNGTVADLTGTQGDINGFQLSYAPEPSAVCLLGLLPVAGLLNEGGRESEPRRSGTSRWPKKTGQPKKTAEENGSLLITIGAANRYRLKRLRPRKRLIPNMARHRPESRA